MGQRESKDFPSNEENIAYILVNQWQPGRLCGGNNPGVQLELYVKLRERKQLGLTTHVQSVPGL